VSPAPLVAVLGAGVAGLSAARELVRLGATVIVLESSDLVGGKVRVSDVGGLPVDEGADSLLRRVPWGVDLAEQAGFTLIAPASGAASLLTRGVLKPLPVGTVMGIPADLDALAAADVLSAEGLSSAQHERAGEPVTEDLSVGDLVGSRLGREVVDRLVDPLLGGVYAGRADQLSVQATLPQLWPHLAQHRSLLDAARAARGTPGPGPVFAGIEGGLGHLPPVLAEGLDVRLRTTARALLRTPTGWRIETGSAAEPAFLDVDAVVLAVPAVPAARLLAGHAATEELAGLAYASVGIVTLVLDGPSPGTGSGYLVPAVEDRVTKAVTFTSRKWGRSGPAIVRASVGRIDDVRDLQRDDEDLVTVVLAELAHTVGPLPQVLASRVTRWGGGLPQYAVGHLDLVRRLRASLPAGLAVAGAAYDGVGLPAVARSGLEAAQVVVAGLGTPTPNS
jgi:oxygen-dependent protoporphyrinogen oxidase